MRIFRIPAILLSLVGAGCVSRPVLYNPTGMPAPAASTTRVLFDRWGDLYPSVHVDTLEMKRLPTDSLSGYYEYLKQQRRPEWRSLLGHYGVEDGEFLSTWQTVQDSIVARTVRAAVATAGEGPLIILSHGYNTTGGGGINAYSSVRAALQRRGIAPGGAGILEVYWDGRTDLGQHLRKNKSAWGWGQNTAYAVGLGLRRILNTVPHETPVRILTHSHGGKVASVALWNVTTSLDNVVPAWERWYDSLRMEPVRYSTPRHPNIRLAMIVPAMPGNVLGDYADTTDNTTPIGGGMVVDRIVVGQNRRDKTIQKNWLIIPLPAYFGSTTLGARSTEYRAYASLLNLPGQPPVAFCVDFANSPGPNLKKHDWPLYMQRDAVREVLDLLFLDDIPQQRYRCRGVVTP